MLTRWARSLIGFSLLLNFQVLVLVSPTLLGWDEEGEPLLPCELLLPSCLPYGRSSLYFSFSLNKYNNFKMILLRLVFSQFFGKNRHELRVWSLRTLPEPPKPFYIINMEKKKKSELRFKSMHWPDQGCRMRGTKASHRLKGIVKRKFWRMWSWTSRCDSLGQLRPK